jgi:hypothetical protein
MDWIQFSILSLMLLGFLATCIIFLISFFKESKSFHGRLCTIEERYYQLMQRMWGGE